MAVLGDDVVSSGGNGAVYELVVVLVNVAKQVEAEEGLSIDDQRMMRDGFDYIMRHSRGGMLSDDFLVLG